MNLLLLLFYYFFIFFSSFYYFFLYQNTVYLNKYINNKLNFEIYIER